MRVKHDNWPCFGGACFMLGTWLVSVWPAGLGR